MIASSRETSSEPSPIYHDQSSPDATLIRLLSNLPPQQWAETRRRFEAVERFRRISNPTLADADAAAAELGLSQASFYRAVSSFDPSRIRNDRRPKEGSGPALHPRSGAILQAAIATASPSARASDIHWEARRRCEAEGVPPPSQATVFNRLRRSPPRGNLPALLRRSFNLVLDAAPLDLATSRSAAATPIGVVALLSPNGRVPAYRLVAWPPCEGQALSVLDAPPPDLRFSGGALIWTKAIPRLSRALIDRLRELGIASSALPSGLAPGSAIRAAFGDRLGRIGVLSRGKPQRRTLDRPADHDDAEAVVARLVGLHNAMRGGSATSEP